METPEQIKAIFLQYAEEMINTIGFKATLIILAENFLDEMDDDKTGRWDGLIDIPIR